MKKLAIALMLISTPLWAAPPFTPAQEARIKVLIKETLIENPSILAQAADAYNQQAEQQQQNEVKQIISQNKDALYNDSGSPHIGASKPKLTLVLFTDYNCPYCKQFDPYMEKIIKAHPEVEVVFKFLPFRSASSLTSARDALTVWETQPDRFLAFNDRLMAKKGYHDDASIKAAEKTVGVTVNEPSKRSLETIKTNLALANKLRIQGTPAILIGDTLLSGYVPYDQFEKMVETELAKVEK